MSDDYGYFGEDSEGYAHYTDATEEKDEDIGGNHKQKHIGCGTGILIGVVVLTLLSAIANGDFSL